MFHFGTYKMGTNGTITVRLNGGVKFVIYIQFDAYPMFLGVQLMHFIASQLRVISAYELRDMFDSLKVVDASDLPTQDDIDKLKPYTDRSNSWCEAMTWYDLLYKTRHNIGLMVQSGHVIDYSNFNVSPQYSYTLDFDSMIFECDEFHWHVPFANLEKFMGLYEQMEELMVY